MRPRVIAVSLLLALAAVQVAYGGEIEDEPFSLRILLALDRASNFAEALGLQASVAKTGGGSANPAGRAELLSTESGRLTLSTVHVLGSPDPWFSAVFGDVGQAIDDRSVVSLAYARTDTYDGDAKDSFDNVLRSNEFYVRYARRLNEALDLGLELRMITAHLEEESVPLGSDIPLRVETDLIGPDLTIGILGRVSEALSLGATVGFGVEWADASVENIEPVPLPIPGAFIPPKTNLDELSDRVVFGDARVGIGWMLSEDLGLYVDAQYVHIETDELGAVDAGRAYVGGEWRPGERLALRVGISVDTDGEVTASGGGSTRIGESMVLDLSYQHSAFPEVEAEFGTLHQLAVSVLIQF